MANVSTSTKGVHKKLCSDIALTDDQSFKKKSGVSSVTVDDCLDQDQACIFFSGKTVWKKAVSIGHSHATKSDFMRLGQFISHLLLTCCQS